MILASGCYDGRSNALLYRGSSFGQHDMAIEILSRLSAIFHNSWFRLQRIYHQNAVTVSSLRPTELIVVNFSA